MLPTLALLAALAVPGQPDRPNVLLILTDDQGYGDFGLHGNPTVKTPNLDAFAKANTRFERFYVSPLCAPTRASLLTGRYSLRTGVWGVTHNKETMRADEVTLAEALRAAGYRTGCFGKWHNGEQWPYTAPGQGFDDFVGFHNGHWNNYLDAEILRGSKPHATKGYLPDVLTDEALAYMKANRDRPWLCYVAYHTPHSPFQVPDRYYEPFKNAGLEPPLAAIYGMVANLDDNFGRLLKGLDDLDLAKKTIVLSLCDNGPNGARFNAGLRGTKGSVHEGGCRSPLFLRWPGNAAGKVIPQIAAHIDLYPTLLDLCGVAPPKGPPVDGRSLRPLLEGRADAWPDRLLFTHHVQGDQWQRPFPCAVRSQRFTAVRELRGDWQLYDIAADPGQKADLAKEKAAELATLTKAYDAWYADVSKGGCVRFPLPVGHVEEDPVMLHAPQAYFDGLKFHGGPGYANDWLTVWADAKARLWFEIDVARPGKYEATLRYAQPTPGVKVRLAAGTASVAAELPAAEAKEIPLPHRDIAGKVYVNRAWAEAKLGLLDLAKGVTKLELSVADGFKDAGPDVKGLSLRRVE